MRTEERSRSPRPGRARRRARRRRGGRAPPPAAAPDGAGAGDPDAGAQYGEGRFGQLTDWIEWQSDHSSGGGCV